MVKELSNELLGKIRKDIEDAKPFRYYWDNRDQLSDDHINKLLMLPDGKQQVFDEIAEYNVDAFGQVEHAHILEILKGFVDEIADDLGLDVEEVTDGLLDELYYKHELIFSSPGIDADFRTIVSNTKPRAVLQLRIYQENAGYLWRESIQYADVRHVLAFFNINPRKIDSKFPNLPYRNGQEYLAPHDLIELWDSAPYGGQYVIPIDLNLWDFSERRDQYFTGIILPKNTEIWLHSYFYGAGSTSVCLKKELRILRKDVEYTFGDDNKTVGTSLKSVYGLSNGSWNNEIYTVTNEPVNPQQLRDPKLVVGHFVNASSLTDFQTSYFISAYYSQKPIADHTIPKEGVQMESNITSSLWPDFPYSAKKYLRTVGNKHSEHLAIRFYEYLGEVEVLHCQLLIEVDNGRVIWSKVERSARSRSIFKLLKARIEHK